MKTWTTGNGITITRVLEGRSNVFLVEGKATRILVDTCTAKYRKKLDSRLKAMGISTIDYLVLTHAHFDHASNAAFIKSEYNARVLIHCDESAFLEKGENVRPRGTNPFIDAIVRPLGKLYMRSARYEPCTPDVMADESFVFQGEDQLIRIVHTPGHTQGSVSLIVDNEIAITGDAMFGVFPNRIMPPFGNDIKEIVISWGRLLDSGCRIFLPSHGSERTMAVVERNFSAFKNKMLI